MSWYKWAKTKRIHPEGEHDADYIAAVERGDMETAQRMVDEAAKAAGYNIGPVFHGTQSNKRFDTFVGMWNYRFEEEKGTSYFTDNMNVAKGYGVRVISAYLKMQNPLVVDAKGEHWTIASPSALVQARKQGNDGVVIQNVMDVPAGVPQQLATVYVTFTSDFPSQIKFADPITRDAAGKVIPLSRRFDDTNADYIAELEAVVTAQRGAPEAAMLAVQKEPSHGGLLDNIVESGGDLSHRYAKGLARYGKSDLLHEVTNKLRNTGYLTYGFEKELTEQLKRYAKQEGKSFEDVRTNLMRLLNKFADAHATIPSPNETIRTINQANIAVGRGRFLEAGYLFNKVRQLVEREVKEQES